MSQQCDVTRRRALSRDELDRWALFLTGLAYWGNVVRGAQDQAATAAFGPSLVVAAILTQGAFCVAAWVLIATDAATRGGARRSDLHRAAWRDIAVTAALGLLCAIPTRQTALLAMLALAGRLAARRRSTAALLAALSLGMAWTSTYAMPLHALSARLDAVTVQAVVHGAGLPAAAHGNIVDGANGFSLEILGPCAASFPLAGVVLAFLVVILHQQNRLPRRADLPWLAAALTASVALTELRLAWMATGETAYRWLHDGYGGTLYSLAALALAVLPPLYAGPRARPVTA